MFTKSTLLIIALCVAASSYVHANGYYGFDLSGAECDGSSWKSSTQFPCFKNAGLDFAIVQSWRGGHGATKSIKYCMGQAKQAGLKASVYMYICPGCAHNENGFNTTYNHIKELQSQGVDFQHGWLDIEECASSLGHCWTTDQTTNGKYLEDAIEGAKKALGPSNYHKVGIYANKFSWDLIMGDNRGFSEWPLWYPRYSNRQVDNFDDFIAFGGWNTTSNGNIVMKQWNDKNAKNSNSVDPGLDAAGCFSNVDLDWAPTLSSI
jgi:GH25 family lysozyme M1 (1,4-beta-N-acetylmuramidase)